MNPSERFKFSYVLSFPVAVSTQGVTVLLIVKINKAKAFNKCTERKRKISVYQIIGLIEIVQHKKKTLSKQILKSVHSHISVENIKGDLSYFNGTLQQYIHTLQNKIGLSFWKDICVLSGPCEIGF